MNSKSVKQSNAKIIDDIVNWYEKNVSYKLTRSFINFLIKTGIIKDDLTLENLNLLLLERYGDEYVKENGLFKMKKSRIDVIKNYPDNVEATKSSNVKEDKPKNKPHRFKIERLGSKKLKLIKI